LRIAAFLAQCCHESAGFTIREENLNYSDAGLKQVFGKYFPTDALAATYARKPEKIANRVYANRMGNGPESSGDGWKFKGRGIIQLTGKDNYRKASKAIFGNEETLLNNPNLLCSNPDTMVAVACWFWKTNSINVFADKGDIDGVSDKVNFGRKTEKYGDSWGFKDRLAYYNKILTLL
jgi:putative chitinase